MQNKETLPKLLKKAERYCNKFIRLRDKNKPCVSCGQFKTLEAGHFYSAGHYSILRFDENNIHGQCHRCNVHLHGNLNEYRRRIAGRIGEDGLKQLDMLADLNKRQTVKWDRFELLQKIECFKEKIKELKQ